MRQLLHPTDVDALLNYPRGRSVRLARAGKLAHVVLPDGEIRFREEEIEQIVNGERRGEQEGAKP